jgi:prepilin-type N-terminal cleavage/methylation domain-containing protein
LPSEGIIGPYPQGVQGEIVSRFGKRVFEVRMKSIGHRCPSKCAGYSLVEMMMTLAIGLILVSMALPVLIGTIQNYRLNSIVQQTANFVELARYTAIRRNTIVTMRQTKQSGNTAFYIDLNGNGNLDASDPMLMLPSDMQVANNQSLTPDPASTGVKNLQDFAGSITFDYRGTVNYPVGGPTGAYFLALGYTTQVQYGCRAITVIPMGQTKLWKAPAGGTWTWM